MTLAIAPLLGYAAPAVSESQHLGETQTPRAIVDWAALQRGLKRAFDLKAFVETNAMRAAESTALASRG